MKPIEQLMKTDKFFLTDGGMETWLFFVEELEAPEFAAITLMRDEKARRAMRQYFDRFLSLAEKEKRGYVLDTNTWRGCINWAEKLGLNPAELLELSREAIDFAKEIRRDWQDKVAPILINAVVGPAGDGYQPGSMNSAAEAERIHQPQISDLAECGVDMLSAITMTNSAEAIGIANAAASVNLPSVISFTVETDACLPSGESLAIAIETVDQAAKKVPLYYMVNCAHPDHFAHALQRGEGWVQRIGGLRANASRLSHEELDNAESLDDGNPAEFGHLHQELLGMLPNLRVIGGCCGTDHRHVSCVLESCAKHKAA